MPQLGETVTEGTITRWLKQVGDSISEDEVLFEVSTDKVDSEVPSPSAGFLSEILVPEGETVDVGTRLAVISAGAPAEGGEESSPVGGEATAEGSSAADAEGGGAQPAGAGPGPEADADPEVAPSGEDAPAPEAKMEKVSTPQTAPVDQAPQPAPDSPQPAPVATSPTPAPSSGDSGDSGDSDANAGNGDGASRVLSPVVRRLITDYKLDPNSIPGTGSGGRITRSDVLAFIDHQQAPSNGAGQAETQTEPPVPSAQGAAATPSAPEPAAATRSVPAASAPAVERVVAGDRDTVVPFTNIRRRTAEHMVRSKAVSAHTMVAVEVDYSAVDRARHAAKATFKEQEGFSLTYLPFISRAVVDSLADWPHMNSSVGDQELIVHKYINLGIAVDLNFEGLLVPVIHDADGKRLRQIAREISGLAGKARAKRLTMDDISDGTFTLTNAGPFGTLLTVPVINQPQVAILSTDGVTKKPVVIESADGTDAIAIHPVGNLVLSWDHRAVDGAYAAAFLARVRDTLETRDWAGEL